MEIRFTPLTPRTHRLEVVREDGTAEVRELETRSLLLHDLVHLAVEAEYPLAHGFWGHVAEGARLDGDWPPPGSAHVQELDLTEKLVGPMQSLWNGRMSDAQYLALTRSLGADEDFVVRVRERLRRLTGHWKSTRHGQTMELRWPLA